MKAGFIVPAAHGATLLIQASASGKLERQERPCNKQLHSNF